MLKPCQDFRQRINISIMDWITKQQNSKQNNFHINHALLRIINTPFTYIEKEKIGNEQL